MFRKISEKLNQWKNSNKRKPLLLVGARQTGKTFIIREFAKKEYDDYLEINFEVDENISKIFLNSLNPIDIISKLENYFGRRIYPNKTLLFFDEIQSSEKAITSLKYFNELANEYHIIAAGSLLGVVLNRKNVSFPVGKVYELKMYPMDFEEFLIALNQLPLIESIKESYKFNKPLDNVLHNKAMEYYKTYLVIGGMPEVVQEYVDTHSYIAATETVERIYNDYLNDLPKYTSSSEAIKNRACYDTIIPQLFKENKNFKYSEVIKGKNSQYFGSSIDWLICAGMILKSKLIDIPSMPLVAHVNNYIFRLYLSDVGMFRYCAKTDISTLMDINYRDDTTGLLAENYVACEFASANIPLYYWVGKRNSEIEFIVEKQNKVIPVEVKAGIRVTSKSLDVYKEMHRVDYVYRISGKNFGFENNIKSIPLYAVFCLTEELLKK